MRRLLPLFALTLPACAPTVDVSGSWLGELYADDSGWATALLTLSDEGRDVGGSAQVGSGGEMILDTTVVGTQTPDTLTLTLEGPDARTDDTAIAYRFTLTADVVGEDELQGTFVASAPGAGIDDLLEGRTGMWIAGPMPTE